MSSSIFRTSVLSFLLLLLNNAIALCQPVIARFSAPRIDPPFAQEMVENFRAQVESRLGTMLRLTPNLDLPSGQLVDELKQGRLDIAVMRVGTLPGRAGLKGAALEQPWTYGSIAELRRAVRSDVGGVVLGTLPDEGLLGLGLWTSGFTRIASQRAFASLDDLRGRTIGIFGPPATQRVVGRLGVMGVATSAGEVAQAMTAGHYDTSEVTPTLVLTPRSVPLHTVVDDPLRARVFAVVVRQIFWMGLPYGVQEGLARIVDERTETINRLAESNDAGFRAASEAQGVRFLTLRLDEIERVRSDSLAVWSETAALPERDLLNRARLAAATPVAFAPATPDRIKADVFVATDRKDEGTANAPNFGVKRDIDQLNLARVRVELPRTEPLATDVARTVVVERTDRFADAPTFVAALREVLAAKQGTRILVHIHGYNNTLGYALRRTAALERELGFPGVVVLYSWPSLGEAPAYGYDNDSIMVTAQNFERFMGLLESVVDRGKISILVHSMGSRVWVDYIHVLKQRAGPHQRYDQVILAAADVSRDLFDGRHQEVSDFANKMAVYVAESDRTLSVSETISSGERLGRPASGRIFISAPIETVDATNVADLNGWWQHSYVFETRQGLADLRELLLRGTAPSSRRGMSARQQAGKTYWYLTR